MKPGKTGPIYPVSSWSSAHVAGVVALMLSANPFLNNVEIENILLDTIQDKGVFGRDIYYGWGLVDCYKAVKRSRDLMFADIVTDSLDYRLHPYNNDISHILKW
ncbi:MAG: S8 family serine peptidase [Actinomycetota bacterium]|nr:S8 family serine peptidase [Actinomycetota bacterium]